MINVMGEGGGDSVLSLTTSIVVVVASSVCILFLAFLINNNNKNKKKKSGGLPPGPRGWPIIGNLMQVGPAPHRGMAALAKEHGPLMHLRLGMVDVVVASSAQVASQFLKTHDANFSSRPPNSGAKHMAYNYQDLVFAPYGPRWRMLRKITSLHLFSAKALHKYRHIRHQEILSLLHNVRQQASHHASLVNVGQMINLCAVNALGRVMLGHRVFAAGDDGAAQEFKSMVSEVMTLAGVFNLGDFVPALDCLDLQGVASRMKRLHKRFDHFLTGILQDHMGSDSQDDDLLSTLLSQDDLTHTEIKALLLNMFTAGTDTTSSTVEWAMAELIRHPAAMSKLQDELQRVVGQGRVVEESDLPRLAYLQAVVKETFRLHPSTPLSLPRMAEESCEVNGYRIPKGSTLLVNVWAIGRDPAEWREAEEFRPERFMEGGEKAGVDIQGNDMEVIPFGAGRRICAGMTLGLRMVQILTATLVHAFHWDHQNLNMDEAYGLTLQRAVPLLLHPTPTLPLHLYAPPPQP